VGELAARNVETLERALRDAWRGLHEVEPDGDRRWRAEALALIERYTALLRLPATRGDDTGAYLFKLVLADGRWWVDEKRLATAPREGDVLVFEGRGRWRVGGRQRIGVRPARKPAREIFLCVPAP